MVKFLKMSSRYEIKRKEGCEIIFSLDDASVFFLSLYCALWQYNIVKLETGFMLC